MSRGIDLDPVTGVAAVAHAALGAACLGLSWAPARKILGVHPALKPMKFAFSIASFLLAMALVLPLVDVPPVLRGLLSLVLTATMVVEMLAIGAQSLRGVTSHFNVGDRLSRALWTSMVFAIVVTTVAFLGLSVVATVRPLRWPDGTAVDPLLTIGVRAGLWPFVFVAFTGASMAGRRSHSVGGADGGPGLPVVNWSTTHGDLRVPHFLGLHALHVFPSAALVVSALPIAPSGQSTLLASVIVGWLVLTMWSLASALRGRPVS